MCVWGLSPLSHQDDASRAVLAAMNIQQAIRDFCDEQLDMGHEWEPPVHMGVSTGNVFAGVVGTEGLRKEIVVLGDSIERALLIMQTANRKYGKIFVDFDTKMDASIHIDFQYFEHIEFAQKLINCPIFEPLNPIVKWWDYNYSEGISDIQEILRLHANPFFIDFENEYQLKFSNLFAHKDVVEQILEEIKYYATQSWGKVWVMAIKGQVGSGKSLFIKNLYMATQKN